MYLADKTDETMTLKDRQMDKVVAISLLCLACAYYAFENAWDGYWPGALFCLVLIAVGYFYVRYTRIHSSIVFDRTKDKITMTVEGGRKPGTWEWPLSQLATSELSGNRDDGGGGISAPCMIMKDGTPVPLRPYHSAGGQSWNAVAAIRLFLGQTLEDAPAGWIPPSEFDEFFEEEMKRLYKK